MSGVPFTLPCGVYDSNGDLQREVTIRPWRAKVKRLLGKLSEKDAVKAIDIVLQESVESVSGFETVSKRLLEDMLIPDREFCALQARILSRGPIVDADVPCINCRKKMKGIKLDLTNVEVGMIDEYPEIKTMPEVDARGQATGRTLRVFTLSIPGGEWSQKDLPPIEATFRIGNGADAAHIGSVVSKNPIEGAWVTWSRTCLKWGDRVPPFPLVFWDELTTYQLEALEDSFARFDGLGPKTMNEVECSHCGEDTPVSIYATDFLLRLPRRSTRTR